MATSRSDRIKSWSGIFQKPFWEVSLSLTVSGCIALLHVHVKYTHKPLFIVLISFVSSKLIPPNLKISRSCVEGRAESSDACDVWRLVVNVQANAHITDALHQLETSLWVLLGISNFEHWVSCRLGHAETPAGVPWTRCVQWRAPIQNHWDKQQELMVFYWTGSGYV